MKQTHLIDPLIMKPKHSKLDASKPETFRSKFARNVPARQLPSNTQMFDDPRSKTSGFGNNSRGGAAWRYARLRRAVSWTPGSLATRRRPIWSALTGQRFLKRRLVAALQKLAPPLAHDPIRHRPLVLHDHGLEWLDPF